jgi:hypothetical protein
MVILVISSMHISYYPTLESDRCVCTRFGVRDVITPI